MAKSDRKFTTFEANGKLYQYCRLPFGVTNEVAAFRRIIDNLIERYKLQNTFAYLDNVTVAGMSQEDHDKTLQALLQAAKTEGFTFNENKLIYSIRQLDLLGYRVSHGQKNDPARLQPLMDYPVLKSQKELVFGNVCVLRALDSKFF